MDDSLPPGHPNKLTLDHVIPLAEGGLTIEENCAFLCGRCNGKKSAQLPSQHLNPSDYDVDGSEDW